MLGSGIRTEKGEVDSLADVLPVGNASSGGFGLIDDPVHQHVPCTGIGRTTQARGMTTGVIRELTFQDSACLQHSPP